MKKKELTGSHLDNVRYRILSSAKELFIQYGYKKTTIRQIVEKSGVLTGSIYYFFKNKEDIFQALILSLLRQCVNLINEHFADSTPAFKYAAMISFALIILTAEGILRIYDKAPYGPLFLLAGAFSFTAIALSMMAASLFRTELQFVRASIMYTVPAFIMAGASFPLESMSQAMVFLGRLFPMSWLTNSVRSLILSGTAPEWNADMIALLSMLYRFSA